jgi:tetratricopeptide (TPR) repeat protein
MTELSRRRIDLRMLKYKNYIRRHPEKAYGYYSLGKLKLIVGQHKEAVQLFNKALSLDNKFVYARIGMIEYYISRRKSAEACRYFGKHSGSFTEKNIHMIRLIKAVSSFYVSNIPDLNHLNIFQLAVRKYEFFLLRNRLDRDPANTVAVLLVCINSLFTGATDENAMALYSKCIGLRGLCDNMRWAIISRLSEKEPSLLRDLEIASMFDRIPDRDCPQAYINTIFEAFVKTKDIKEVKRLFNSIPENDKILSLPNQWKYILKCTENSFYDLSVYKCCRRLINAGWVDNILAGTLFMLKELKITEKTEDEEKILNLFGYDTPLASE